MALTAEQWQVVVLEIVAVRGILQQTYERLAVPADASVAEELLQDADARLRRVATALDELRGGAGPARIP